MGAGAWLRGPGQLGRRSLLVSLVPLLLAATTTAVLLSVLSQTRQADDEVQRGLRALGQIHAVHAALAEAASGVRGFIITRDETFLRPYHRAEQKLSDALALLERDIEDPAQRDQLAEITRLVDIKLANLAMLTARSRELSAGQMLSYSRENKALLDRLRQHIAAMEAREHDIIARLQQRQQATRQVGLLVSVVAVLAAFALASVLSQGFAAGLIRRIRHLRDNARRIVRREPLAEYPRQPADELAELDTLLVQTGRTLYQKLEELEAARQAADQASQAKTRFLSRTSHELRTPINAVLGFSGLLRKHIEQPGQRRQLEAIERSAQHLLRLVDDLLDLSRIEAGQMVPRQDVIDLLDPIARALEIVHGRAAARQIRVYREGCDDLPPVRGDAGRLVQVLINLLDNAVKFSPPGSSVLLRGEHAHGRVCLHVVDEGPGIPAHFETDLFRPFSRQDGQHEGAGLGLAISHGLMRAMGGDLRFSPASHGGSCFTLQLDTTAAPALGADGHRGVAGAAVEPPVPAPPSAPALRVVMQTGDEAFALRIEATAQRLGLACTRVDPAGALPGGSPSQPWLLVRDARSGEPPVLGDSAVPVGAVFLGRQDVALPDTLPVRVLPGVDPAGAWRAALQEILDEHAATRHP